MRKKDYQKMTMKVVQLKHKCQILAGSGEPQGRSSVQNYGWETETEE
jgi:hypothetical protein